MTVLLDDIEFDGFVFIYSVSLSSWLVSSDGWRRWRRSFIREHQPGFVLGEDSEWLEIAHCPGAEPVARDLRPGDSDGAHLTRSHLGLR